MQWCTYSPPDVWGEPHWRFVNEGANKILTINSLLKGWINPGKSKADWLTVGQLWVRIIPSHSSNSRNECKSTHNAGCAQTQISGRVFRTGEQHWFAPCCEPAAVLLQRDSLLSNTHDAFNLRGRKSRIMTCPHPLLLNIWWGFQM